MQDAGTGSEAPGISDLDRRSSWAAHNWGWVLAFGVVAIAFGAALISSAFTSFSALAWLAGLFLVFAGVVELVAPLGSGGRRRQLTGAVIAVVGGLVLLVWPGETLTVVAFVAGIALTAWGIVSIVTALLGARDGRTREIVVGAGSAALGILVMAWPAQTVAVVGVIIGIVAAVWGVVTLVHAVELRGTGRAWEESRRLERESIDEAWKDFERSEEIREAGGDRLQGEVAPSGEIEAPEKREAA